MNPVFNDSGNVSSNSKSESLAAHFRTKIENIWLGFNQHPPLNFNTCKPCGETLDSFALVDTPTLRDVILQLKSSTCLLDPILTQLFESVHGFLSRHLLNMINYSLQTIWMPQIL